MSTIARITFALTLGIAACAAAVTPARPAHACGSYADIDDTRARAATFAFMHEKMPDATDKRIHSVTVDGRSAKVQIRFRRPKATEDSAQMLALTKGESGAWKVTGIGYAVPASMARHIGVP